MANQAQKKRSQNQKQVEYENMPAFFSISFSRIKPGVLATAEPLPSLRLVCVISPVWNRNVEINVFTFSDFLSIYRVL